MFFIGGWPCRSLSMFISISPVNSCRGGSSSCGTISSIKSRPQSRRLINPVILQLRFDCSSVMSVDRFIVWRLFRKCGPSRDAWAEERNISIWSLSLFRNQFTTTTNINRPHLTTCIIPDNVQGAAKLTKDDIEKVFSLYDRASIPISLIS